AGPVIKVKIPKDKDGKAKQFVFVNFEHKVSAPYAMNLLYGIKFFGRPIKIQIRLGSNHASQEVSLSYPQHRVGNSSPTSTSPSRKFSETSSDEQCFETDVTWREIWFSISGSIRIFPISSRIDIIAVNSVKPLIMGLTIITEKTEMISSMKIGITMAGAMTMITEETVVEKENGAHLDTNK
ncbi:hypothetical protein EI555_004530, partial [Monodon monoceros]